MNFARSGSQVFKRFSSTSVFNTSHLHNKHALVTGASSGIGAATAILFAKAGANVTMIARRQDKLEEVKELAEKANKEGATGQGGKIIPLTLDLMERKSIDLVLPGIKKQNGSPVDILVNNAGGVRGLEKVGDVPMDDIDIMMDLNVKSLMHMTQLFIRQFKERDQGHIINVGSVAGRESYPNGSIYCASKAAVRAFTESTLKENYTNSIRVSEIQPGMVETEFSEVRFRGDKEKASKVYKGIQPLSGHDIAQEIVWVASRPPHCNVAELFVMPVNQASPALIHREKS